MKKSFIYKLIAYIPKRVMNALGFGTLSFFFYDWSRYLKFSRKEAHKTKFGALTDLTMAYHVLEKGLTMPERRLGFGQAQVIKVATMCKNFANKFGIEEAQWKCAVEILAEYDLLHKTEKFSLNAETQLSLNSVLSKYKTVPSQQIKMTRERYFSKLDAPFEIFSASRHSVRHFAGTISDEQIKNAVVLANNAPSACNRQYVRVHCIRDKKQIADCLALQNGNRGFGHLADKLLIVTADQRGLCWAQERNDLFTNAGIYIMNLCYALHKNKVAHCLLNWSVAPATDLALRRVLTLGGGGGGYIPLKA